jgi:hypothetical protein
MWNQFDVFSSLKQNYPLLKLNLCMCFHEDLLWYEFDGTMDFSADNFNSFNNIKTDQFVRFLVIEPCCVPAYLRPL